MSDSTRIQSERPERPLDKIDFYIENLWFCKHCGLRMVTLRDIYPIRSPALWEALQAHEAGDCKFA